VAGGFVVFIRLLKIFIIEKNKQVPLMPGIEQF
jgi:hypothetical protein